MSYNLETILNSKAETIDAQRAQRLKESGIAASSKHVESIKERKRKLEETIQDLMDFSAATNLNSGMKAITSETLGEKITKYHGLSLELELLTKELEVAERIHKELSNEKN